jgi:radical SAM protein with 4Fe4S-binding SPASM domain
MLKIQMNGDVFACSQGQLVGNMNDYESTIEIWNSPGILELSAQLEQENYDVMCKNCPLVQNSLAN